jgi:hypothetical protein
VTIITVGLLSIIPAYRFIANASGRNSIVSDTDS